MGYVITIGRQYGSGGRIIGRKVAEKLGIKFYDNELLDKVSLESGLSVEYLKQNDEKKDNIFSYIGLNDFSNVETASTKVSVAQFQTIRSLAEKEDCVIVGRCADYVLSEHQDTINIFIHAPLEDRINRAINEYGVDKKKAKDFVIKYDKKRSGYYNYFTDKKWGVAENYHLSLSSSLGEDICVELIVKLVKEKFE